MLPDTVASQGAAEKWAWDAHNPSGCKSEIDQKSGVDLQPIPLYLAYFQRRIIRVSQTVNRGLVLAVGWGIRVCFGGVLVAGDAVAFAHPFAKVYQLAATATKGAGKGLHLTTAHRRGRWGKKPW